ncbi:ENV1 protein, partial [Sylvietta virens]|nr:ENV1 protein [Sylvietta virens]
PPNNPLWKLLNTTFNVLNATRPNFTKSCWLCFTIKPPFYEAIGIPENPRRDNRNNPAKCNWKDPQTPGITLASVTGKGKCIG